MIIQDHTFINLAETVHPTCLFETTLLLGPLEYLFALNLENSIVALLRFVIISQTYSIYVELMYLLP